MTVVGEKMAFSQQIAALTEMPFISTCAASAGVLIPPLRIAHSTHESVLHTSVCLFDPVALARKSPLSAICGAQRSRA